jgi:S-ribosylhomocysteine lyase LuxS involved in autoinducer biosynthesis
MHILVPPLGNETGFFALLLDREELKEVVNVD